MDDMIRRLGLESVFTSESGPPLNPIPRMIFRSIPSPFFFRRLTLLVALFHGILADAPAAFPEASPSATPHKYSAEVAKFAEAPAPAPGGVLMVGSSIFRKWTNAAADLAPLPVTNRAFGGSRTADQLFFFDQVVPSSRATLVVWYCGSNDINGKETPGSILQRTKEWIAWTQGALPKARILLVSVIRAPQKREAGYLALVDEVNKGLLGLASSIPGVSYVDVNPPLETLGGDPRMECYVPDKLHMTPEGYRAMSSVMLPVMNREWKASSDTRNP
jgi:lysophospholipase L1-like esterase